MSVASFIWRYLTIGIILVPIAVIVSVIILMWKTNFKTDEETMNKIGRAVLDGHEDVFFMVKRDLKNGSHEATRNWLLWDILLWPVYIPLLSIRTYKALKILDN